MYNPNAYYATHVGLWCNLESMSGLGAVAADEFRFLEDGRFEWLTLRSIGGKDIYRKRSGTWSQVDDVITLIVEFSEEPDVAPQRRLDLKVFDREGRLGLRSISLDGDGADRGSYFLQPSSEGEAERGLAEATRKALATRKLPKPYSMLEPLLVDAIVSTVSAVPRDSKICCARLYYHDTHAPREGFGPHLRVLTEALRWDLKSRAGTPERFSEEFWSPRSGVANGFPGREPGLFQLPLGGEALSKSLSSLHDLLLDSEEEHMPLLRELCRRVCKKVNATKWGEDVPLTDDFVAVPADGSDYFGEEYERDLAASVPSRLIKVLRSRGYLA